MALRVIRRAATFLDAIGCIADIGWYLACVGYDANDLGRVKTPALAVRVEECFRNTAFWKLLMLQTYGCTSCWRTVFSTFSKCMSFHTAKTRSEHEQRDYKPRQSIMQGKKEPGYLTGSLNAGELHSSCLVNDRPCPRRRGCLNRRLCRLVIAIAVMLWAGPLGFFRADRSSVRRTDG